MIPLACPEGVVLWKKRDVVWSMFLLIQKNPLALRAIPLLVEKPWCFWKEGMKEEEQKRFSRLFFHLHVAPHSRIVELPHATRDPSACPEAMVLLERGDVWKKRIFL